MNTSLLLFDTTLRDGSQMSGISFSLQDKLAIAKALDEFGIHYIEGGFPASNPKDAAFFEETRKMSWKNAKICAFGATHHKKYSAEKDPHLKILAECHAPVVVLFGKSSLFHATEILRISPEENLDIITSSIAFLVSQGKEVIFDAEHFFDGYFQDPKYAIQCLHAAEKGGASNITLADTNGGMIPEKIKESVQAIKKHLSTPLGIHTHNDTDLAVANSLAAVEAGVTLIQGTINGLGERCGNANLCSIIPNLQLHMGYDILPPKKLSQLTSLSRFVQDRCNITPRKDLPFVGEWAFRHKGGGHVSAMKKNPKSYQHVNPDTVGNESSTAISELSGRANIAVFLEKRGISANPDQLMNILQEVKQRENKGLSYEAAEASLEILVRHILEEKEFPFLLSDYFIKTEKHQKHFSPEHAVEATVQIEFKNEHLHTAGLGNGPVNALDIALRKSLEPHFPFLKKVELIDFKVRILDMVLGTSAKIRVQIEIRGADGELWQTVGCSQNIIEASVHALFDAYIYAIWKEEKRS